MGFLEEIINKCSSCSEEKVNWDRVYELLDIFENASDYDYIMSDEYITSMCTQLNIKRGTPKFDKVLPKLEKDRFELLYFRINHEEDITEALDYNWDEILSYTAVGINWILGDERLTDNRSAIILCMLEFANEHGIKVFCYNILKYMHEHYIKDKEFYLP